MRLETFDQINVHEQCWLPMFVLYFDPKDFPGKYVVRLFDIDQPTHNFTVSDSEEAAIETIPWECRARLNRREDDQPHIVAVFL
jgi:hypothetical protein